MSTKNLFFDFDEFLFSTKHAGRAYIEHRYSVKVNLDKYFTSELLVENVNKELEDSKKIGHDAFFEDFGKNFLQSEEWHAEVLPMPGMKEALPRLAKQYKLHVVTSRQAQGLPIIKKLIEKHVPGCISHIHCVWTRYEDGTFSSVSKREFIDSTVGENIAFFDDSPAEIQHVADIIPAYLFDPHEMHVDEPDIENRITSWEKIETLLSERK